MPTTDEVLARMFDPTDDPLTVDRWGVISVSTYHYLSSRVAYDEAADDLFQRFIAMTDRKWLERDQDFIACLGRRGRLSGIYGEGEPIRDNTCNADRWIDTEFVFHYFEFESDGKRKAPFDDGRWVIIHPHRGGDYRANYGQPHLFMAGSSMLDSDSLFDYSSDHLVGFWCPGTDPNPDIPVGQLTVDGDEVDHTPRGHDLEAKYPGSPPDEAYVDWDDEALVYRCVEHYVPIEIRTY